MHRLFVALRPPGAIRDAVTALQEGVPGARWQDDDQLHLTLRFVGAVERPVAEDVAAALAAVVAPAPTIRLAGVGRFDGSRGGAALWVGAAPREPLAALHRKVDQACIRAGLAPEGRAYLPHVTLARLSRAVAADAAVTRWLAAHASWTSEAFAPTHLVLYESDLGRDGGVYEAVARWPLQSDGETRT
jgi:2'-5' RNA ligase